MILPGVSELRGRGSRAIVEVDVRHLEVIPTSVVVEK